MNSRYEQGAVGTPTSVGDTYTARHQRFSASAAAHAHSAGRWSLLRLMTGAALIVLLYGAATDGGPTVFLAVLLVALPFGLMVWRHRVEKRRAAQDDALAKLNAQAVHRLDRDWAKLDAHDLPNAAAEPRIATDLNLIGQASLLHLLFDLGSERARRLLLQWLYGATTPAVIAARQQAIDELAPEVDRRQALAVLRQTERDESRSDRRLIAWAENRDQRRQPPPGLRQILTATTILLLVGVAVGVVAPHVLLAVVVINALVSLRYVPAIHKELDALEHGAAALQHYARLIDFVDAQPATAMRLNELKSMLQGPGMAAGTAMRRAQRVLWFADFRHAGVIYLFLQLFTLWSLHVDAGLHAWRRQAGGGVRQWLDALAEYEVLAALAGLRFDHPQWCFPGVGADAGVFRVKGLGHPLLPPARQVYNDVELDQRKPLLLVTGSNMSGKSTLLRSIGLNLLLAKTGAPVCAAELQMPNVALASCFGSHDSLAEGRSLYMAELQCLKATIEQARRAADDGGPMFFLLDEILRGTNSRDRHTAAVFVLDQLMQAKAMGAVATHDLDLAENPKLKPHCHLVHFRETIEDTTQGFLMSFDYVLRPGIAQSSNALQLLQVVGLGMPPESATPAAAPMMLRINRRQPGVGD